MRFQNLRGSAAVRVAGAIGLIAGLNSPAAAIVASLPGIEIGNAVVHNDTIGEIFPAAPGTYSLGLTQLVINTQGTPSLLGISHVASGGGQAYAVAYLKYYFMLTGPGSALVPLNAKIIASIQSVNHGSTQSTVSAGVYISAATSTAVSVGSPQGFDIDYSFNGIQSFLARPGDLDFVLLSVSAGTSADFVHNDGFGRAYADPLISIDPVFAAANPGYSLSFSPGAGNSAGGVPEPAAWGLFVVGFGFTGAAARNLRRKMKTVAS